MDKILSCNKALNKDALHNHALILSGKLKGIIQKQMPPGAINIHLFIIN